MIARKSGFITIDKKINFTEGFLKRNDEKLITIPMLKEISPDSGKAYAILTYNGRLKNVKLRASSS